MLRITQCKIKIETDLELTRECLTSLVAKKLRIHKDEVLDVRLHKQSLDARRKPELFYSLTIDARIKDEERLLKRLKDKRDVARVEDTPFDFGFKMPSNQMMKAGNRRTGRELADEGQADETSDRPLIIGAGPAGLFAAYFLAKNGFAPILIERGRCVQDRQRDVQKFWESGVLDTSSNVQFGEGGAGTFSDGKLNTLVKDKDGRCRAVLKTFAELGAPESILYDFKPHIGTDILMKIVENMRGEILTHGGEVYFETLVSDLLLNGDRLAGVRTQDGREFLSNHVVLAVGHSARDTFEMLAQKPVKMQTKAFAVGLRVQHPQSLINESQYGKQPEEILEKLGSANYKLTEKTESGRGVYTFCMCPGGYVVNASSEEGMLAVNGMSYHKRDSGVANSAVIVTVTPEDYDGSDALAGVRFQRQLEKKAFELGGGKIPVQLLGDFRNDKKSEEAKLVKHSDIRIKGGFQPANLRGLFSEEISASFLEGMEQFDRKIRGFGSDEAILAGVESRTSSPVRIERDETGQSAIKGLYPCGEGAGYAGGITSAAMDGIYIAQCVARDMLGEITKGKKHE